MLLHSFRARPREHLAWRSRYGLFALVCQGELRLHRRLTVQGFGAASAALRDGEMAEEWGRHSRRGRRGHTVMGKGSSTNTALWSGLAGDVWMRAQDVTDVTDVQ